MSGWEPLGWLFDFFNWWSDHYDKSRTFWWTFCSGVLLGIGGLAVMAMTELSGLGVGLLVVGIVVIVIAYVAEHYAWGS